MTFGWAKKKSHHKYNFGHNVSFRPSFFFKKKKRNLAPRASANTHTVHPQNNHILFHLCTTLEITIRWNFIWFPFFINDVVCSVRFFFFILIKKPQHQILKHAIKRQKQQQRKSDNFFFPRVLDYLIFVLSCK